MTENTNLEMDKISDLFTNDVAYETPKLDVRGVVFKNNQVLLVKENEDDKWALPGGFCDIGLSPSENVVKEIKEESGYDVMPIRLLALLDKNKHPHPPDEYHYYKIFILCEITGGEATLGIETSNIQFFSENNLPQLSTNRNTKSQVKTLFEFLRNPEKPTLFDK